MKSKSSHRYGKSHAIRDHTVLPATQQWRFSRVYPQPKLVLDLATPEGCKAELTWVSVISQHSFPANTFIHFINDRAVGN